MNRIVDWIFSIRLTGDINIAGRRSGKIQPQDIHPATAGLRSFEFGFALFEAFDTPVSAASQNTNQFSKSAQSLVKFSAVQSIYHIYRKKTQRNNNFSTIIQYTPLI